MPEPQLLGDLASAATSAMPQTQQGQPANTADPTALIKAVIQMTQGNQANQGPLVTPQTAMPQPRLPQEPFQAGTPQIAQGPFGTTGERKRADLQANLSNLATFAQKGAEFFHQKKVREASSLYERVLTAFQGLQEGTQAQNKEMVDRNKQILNDIFSDPKKMKILQKGFDVKLLGDDKGKATPEYQGMQKAMKDWIQGGKKDLNPMAQKFQQSFPQVMGLSPTAQATMAAIKGGMLPKAGEQLTAQTEILKAIQTSMDKGFDRQSREAIADKLANVKDVASQRQMFGVLSKVMGQQKAAEIMSESRIKAARIHAGAIIQSAEWHAAGQVIAAGKRAGTSNKIVGGLSQEMQRMMDRIKENNKELDNMGTAITPWGMVSNYKKSQRIEKDNEMLFNNYKTILNQMNQMNIGVGLSDAGADGNQSGGVTKQGTGTDDFDKFFESLTQDEGDSGEN